MSLEKLLIMALIFILATGAVSANEDPLQENSTLLSENTHEIDETNYDIYFNSSTGRINENADISNGDTLIIGNLTDKKIIIDKNLTLMPMTSNDKLINSMINLIPGSDGSIINGIKIINNENTTFINAMELTKSNNVRIFVSLFNSTNPIKINLLVNESNNVLISNSTFIKYGIYYISQIYSTDNCDNLSIRNCIFKGNNTGSIISKDLRKIEKNSSKFEASFLDALSPLKYATVTFKINNIEYKRTTDNNGIARIAINLEPGNYTMQSINPKTGEIKNNTITVLPRIVDNNDLEKYFRNGTQYVVKILDDNGNPAKSGEIVTFNINGVFYNRTTNETGHVKLNINLNPGEYIITVEYKGCKVSNKITVKSILYADNLIKKYGTPDQFKVKLLDGTGNVLKNANVTFNINGVFYTRTTNEEGIAKLNINLQPGEYIISSMYNEACIANKITVTT